MERVLSALFQTPTARVPPLVALLNAFADGPPIDKAESGWLRPRSPLIVITAIPDSWMFGIMVMVRVFEAPGISIPVDTFLTSNPGQRTKRGALSPASAPSTTIFTKDPFE